MMGPFYSYGNVMHHEQLVADLGRLCGLSEGERADRCGQTWCAFYDGAMGTCGLLAYDVPPASLAWFVARRRKHIEPLQDEALAARVGSL